MCFLRGSISLTAIELEHDVGGVDPQLNGEESESVDVILFISKPRHRETMSLVARDRKIWRKKLS